MPGAWRPQVVQALSLSVLLMLCMQYNGPSGKRPRGSESGLRLRAPPAWHSQHCALKAPLQFPFSGASQVLDKGHLGGHVPLLHPGSAPGK